MSFLQELQQISGPSQTNRSKIELEKVKSMLRSCAKTGNTQGVILVQNRYVDDVIYPLSEDGLHITITGDHTQLPDDRFIEITFSWAPQ